MCTRSRSNTDASAGGTSSACGTSSAGGTTSACGMTALDRTASAGSTAAPDRTASTGSTASAGKGFIQSAGKGLAFTVGVAAGLLGAAALINHARHNRSLAASFYDLVLRNTGDKDVYGSIQSADAFLARHAKHNEDFRHVARKLHFALPYTWYKETLSDEAYTCIPELAHPHFSQPVQEVLVLNPRTAQTPPGSKPEPESEPKPEPEPTEDVVLYLHGGAFVLNLSEQTLGMIESLTELSGKQFVVPLYPLAPEDTYVETYAMIMDVYLNLVKRHGAEHVILAGDSAGGCLSIGLTQMLIRHDLPTPKLLVLLSPSVNNALDNPGIDEIEPLDPLLNPVGIREVLRAWAGSADLHDPHISPLFAPVEGFPPVFLSAGTHEILYPDQKEFITKLHNANIPVETVIAPEMLHDYGMFSTPEAFTLLRRASACIKAGALELASEIHNDDQAHHCVLVRLPHRSKMRG